MTEQASTAVQAFIQQHDARLRALVDDVVPADAFPSASEAGALDFLSRVLAEHPDWLDRVRAVVAGTDAADVEWFTDLVATGYYADAANGGNADERSWDMVGWQPGPPTGWSVPVPVATAPPTVVHPASLGARYDAVVIGSGAGGGVAACGLAESGRRVLVVEAGQWPSTEELRRDHLRNPRSTLGFAPRSGPSDAGNPRVVSDGRERLLLRPSSPAWHNNAVTAGGGTRVYGAQAWRFAPRDFAMASTYGVPDGSALADWPFGYDELEPWYERAEWEVGVSGGEVDGAWAGARGRAYPMPPVASGAARTRLAHAAEAMGISTVHVPLLINTTPYLGRRACEQCGMCVGFACPVDAKNGSQNTMLTRGRSRRATRRSCSAAGCRGSGPTAPDGSSG